MIKKSPLVKRRKMSSKVLFAPLVSILAMILVFFLTHYFYNPQHTANITQIILPEIVQRSKNDVQFVEINVAVTKAALVLESAIEDKQLDFLDFDRQRQQILSGYQKYLKEQKNTIIDQSHGTKDDLMNIKIAFYSDKEIAYDVIDALIVAASEVGINTFSFQLK